MYIVMLWQHETDQFTGTGNNHRTKWPKSIYML